MCSEPARRKGNPNVVWTATVHGHLWKKRCSDPAAALFCKGKRPGQRTEVAPLCLDRRNCFIVRSNPSPPTCVMRPSWGCAELACRSVINGSAESACQMFLEPMKEARLFFFFFPWLSGAVYGAFSLGRCFFLCKSTVAGGFCSDRQCHMLLRSFFRGKSVIYLADAIDSLCVVRSPP